MGYVSNTHIVVGADDVDVRNVSCDVYDHELHRWGREH